MKVAVLTTETTHHCYFVQQLTKLGHEVLCLVEDQTLKAKFETKHPFEDEREVFEKEHWFGGKSVFLKDFSETKHFQTLNSAEGVRAMDASFNAIIDFGTGKLGDEVIQSAKAPLLNLHGGNPETYRGLDSHLWAIYHGDFSQLITTLHHLAPALDTGDIVGQLPLKLKRDTKISMLRSINTQACVDLAVDALKQIQNGNLKSRGQQSKGRYYSFMPSVLKAECALKFSKHVAALK